MKKIKYNITNEILHTDTTPLEVISLFKKYNEKADYAIKDVSFKCEKGQIVGLLGSNGAGKSTTLKCVTGMIPISEGSVKVCGYDISQNPIEAKNCFSFVTDNHAVFTKMTGMQYLSFMADVYKVPNEVRSKIIDDLEKVFQLGENINNLISCYSHGMKQKICMMGSLIHEPLLWILDEPMVGLDPRTQNAVTTFMKSYVNGGRSILFSSHNLDIVRRICDRVVIISNGNVVADLVIDGEVKDIPEILESYYLNDENFQVEE